MNNRKCVFYIKGANNRRRHWVPRKTADRPLLYFSVTSVLSAKICSKSFRISFTASQLYKKPHFKMKIQTAIIHIDRATGCRFPVADTLFCMNKSRCVFINYAPPVAPVLHNKNVSLCRSVFIRDSRCDDPHIHPAFCCKSQCPVHLICDDQIRGCEINLLFCMCNEIHINTLSDVLVI